MFVEAESNSVCFSETKKRSDIQLLPEQLESPIQIVTVNLAGADKMSGVDKKFLSKVRSSTCSLNCG